MAEFDANDPEALCRMRAMFSPQQVDQQIRQAIEFCWLMLPPEKKNVDERPSTVNRVLGVLRRKTRLTIVRLHRE